jgi:hypothetical protein
MNVKRPNVSNCIGKDKIIKMGLISAFTIPNMKAAKSAGTSPVILTAGPIKYGMTRRTMAFANHLIMNVRFPNTSTPLVKMSSYT